MTCLSFTGSSAYRTYGLSLMKHYNMRPSGPIQQQQGLEDNCSVNHCSQLLQFETAQIKIQSICSSVSALEAFVASVLYISQHTCTSMFWPYFASPHVAAKTLGRLHSKLMPRRVIFPIHVVFLFALLVSVCQITAFLSPAERVVKRKMQQWYGNIPQVCGLEVAFSGDWLLFFLSSHLIWQSFF